MDNANVYRLFPISGASVASDIELIGGFYVLPEINEEYKEGLFYDNLLWATKDGILFVLAYAVDIKGRRYSLHELEMAMKEEN